MNGFVSAFVVYAGSGLSTIDTKGRVTIPAEIREPVAESSGDNIVCLQRHGSLPCLIGYGRTERLQLRTDLNTQWESAVGRGADLNREALGAGASSIFEVAFEPSGRFVLPPMLRHFGKLGGDRGFFFGVTTHFMLWDPDVFKASAPPTFAQIGEELDYWLQDFARRGK